MAQQFGTSYNCPRRGALRGGAPRDLRSASEGTHRRRACDRGLAHSWSADRRASLSGTATSM
eukprot:5422338-Prymnesium_polylepis.1